MSYSEYLNLNQTSIKVPINIEKVIEVAEPVIGNATGINEDVISPAKDAIVNLANNTLDAIEDLEEII